MLTSRNNFSHCNFIVMQEYFEHWYINRYWYISTDIYWYTDTYQYISISMFMKGPCWVIGPCHPADLQCGGILPRETQPTSSTTQGKPMLLSLAYRGAHAQIKINIKPLWKWQCLFCISLPPPKNVKGNSNNWMSYFLILGQIISWSFQVFFSL